MGFTLLPRSAPKTSPIRSPRSSGENPHRHNKRREGDVVFEQKDCEIPSTWSQLATNVVANKYFYGEVATDGAREGRPPFDPPRLTHDRRLGIGRRLFCHCCRRRTILLRPQLAVPAPACRVQLARVVQRGPVSPVRHQGFDVQLALGQKRAARPFSRKIHTNIRRPRRASSKACATTWKTSWSLPAARPCFLSSARARAPTCPRCGRTAKNSPAAESHPGRCRSCGCTTRLRPWSRAAARRRRAAKMQSIKDWHPDVMEFVLCKNREECKARTLVEQGYDPQEPTTRCCSKTPTSQSG